MKDLNINLPLLALEDFANMGTAEVREKITADFETTLPANLEVLIAYMSVGSWGCDSSAWFLLRERGTQNLFEVSGSHCSCYGFEDQWKPEPTTREYLKSDKFSFSCGGYDDNENANKEAVKKYLAENL